MLSLVTTALDNGSSHSWEFKGDISTCIVGLTIKSKGKVAGVLGFIVIQGLIIIKGLICVLQSF